MKQRRRSTINSSIRLLMLSSLMMVSLSPVALAAATSETKPSEAIFLIQLVLLLVSGRLLGEAMQRIGQPAVMGQLLSGILLGPSLFGALWPYMHQLVFPTSGEQKSMIDAVGQLGILMLLLLTGMETDLSIVRKAKRAALSVSVSGIAIPFSFGFMMGQLMPDAMLPDPSRRFIASLFLGTALSISSVKIVAMVIQEVGFMRRLIGQVIVASAIIDDTIGWTIMAVTFGLAQHGTIDLGSAGRTIIGTALFLVASFTFGRQIAFFMIRWANDSFVMELPVITTIIVLMAVMALITYALGVNTVLGAFVAGVLAGQSPILTKHIAGQLRGLIVAFFMPVFFGLAGQHTDLRVLGDPAMVVLLVAMIINASLGKFFGAFVGGKIGGMTTRESFAVGCGMNARGSTEVIIATLGLNLGVLNQGLFTTIIAMAVTTTLAMPPMLRWAIARVPPRPDEEERLEREAMEARGFVSNFERLLVAVDRSATGRLASRLVGLLAGARRLPTTVLPVEEDLSEPVRPRGEKENVDATVVQAVETPPEGKAEAVIKAVGERVETQDADPRAAPPLHVLTRKQDVPIEGAVNDEAKKGYDLLVIGVEPALVDGEFSKRISRVTEGFNGPVAIIFGRGIHASNPDTQEREILVPVTGTSFSRNGADVALALARAGNATVTALHVVTSARKRTWRRRLGIGWTDGGEGDAILHEITLLGEQQGVRVNPILWRYGMPEDAILEQLRSGRFDLIIMGVSQRSGRALSFGAVAESVLDHSQQSVILVSS